MKISEDEDPEQAAIHLRLAKMGFVKSIKSIRKKTNMDASPTDDHRDS